MPVFTNPTTAADIVNIESLLLEKAHSSIGLVNEVVAYLIAAGGKRFRPMLTTLFARACCAELNTQQTTATYSLAVIIEFIHSATLLHDDVVDSSNMRRGQSTANHKFSNASAVLVGDFIYSRAFQMMVDHSIEAIRILADTTNRVAEGEVQQLLNVGRADEEDYLQVIEKKTAQLFSAAAELGALSADNHAMRRRAADYGLALGIAFQIVDDMLDYTGEAEETGKNIGIDLQEGKITLPLIYCLQNPSANVTEQEKEKIHAALALAQNPASIDAGLPLYQEVCRIVKTSGGVDYAQNRARYYFGCALQALEPLPTSVYKQDLQNICRQGAERRH